MTQLNLLWRDWIEENTPCVLSTMAGKQFTSDDLHKTLGAPPQQNWWGVLLARLKNKGLVRRVGYKPSERTERNGGVIAVWEIPN